MVSIVIATYNGNKYFYEQLASILKQTFTDFEIIIIDDCSSDDTVSIAIDTFQKFKFNRYQIFVNEVNIGPTGSFSKGVTYCSGEYVLFSDQDDIWNCEKLSAYIIKANEENADMIFSPSYVLKDEIVSKEIFPKFIHYSTLFGSFFHNEARGATMMVRKNILIDYLPFVNLYDKWIYLLCLINCKVEYIDTPLHFYRLHDQNVNGGGFRYSSIEKLILNFHSSNNLYKKLKLFAQSNNSIKYPLKEIVKTIDSIINFNNETIKNLQQKNKFKSIFSYISTVLFKELTIKEKLIFFYYFVFKF